MTFGFQAPRFPEIRESSVDKWKRQFGQNADTAPDQLDGLLIDIWAVDVAVIYEAVSELVAQRYYTTAEAEALDAILSLFGSKRRDAFPSTSEVILYGDDATVIDVGSTMSTVDVGDVFVLDGTETISAGSIWSVYTFGDALVPTDITITIDGNDTVGNFSFGGTGDFIRDTMSSLVGFDPNVEAVYPVGQQPNGLWILVVQMSAGFSFSIASSGGTDVFSHLGEVGFTTAEAAGKISAVAGTLANVTAPVPGWIGSVNIADATLGADRQSDTEFRAFHEATLNSKGFATPRGLAGSILKLEGVTHVKIFENLSGFPDAIGRPSHSFESVVEGGDSTEIAETIWLNHTTGTQSTGLLNFTVLDDRGQVVQPRQIRFTRPIKQYVHIRYEIIMGERFPNSPIFDLKREVQEEVVRWGEEILMGDDVYLDEVAGRAACVIPGTKSISVTMGTTPGPNDPTPGLAAADIIISDRQWAQFADTRIEVVIF